MRPTPRWNHHEASSKDNAAEARRATGVSLVFATDHGAAAACLDLAPQKVVWICPFHSLDLGLDFPNSEAFAVATRAHAAAGDAQE